MDGVEEALERFGLSEGEFVVDDALLDSSCPIKLELSRGGTMRAFCEWIFKTPVLR